MPMTNEPRGPSAAPAADEWVTLLCDNTRTGGQGAPPMEAPSRARWQLRLGSSVRSAPVMRETTLYVNSLAGTLHAINVETGRLKWKFEAPGQIHSTPSLYKNKVLFGCDDGNVYAGNVYAVNAELGQKSWEVRTKGEVWASPVVRQGVAYFGSADGHVYAADADSGKLVWKQQLGGGGYSPGY